jgi:hypothetical protein
MDATCSAHYIHFNLTILTTPNEDYELRIFLYTFPQLSIIFYSLDSNILLNTSSSNTLSLYSPFRFRDKFNDLKQFNF